MICKIKVGERNVNCLFVAFKYNTGLLLFTISFSSFINFWIFRYIIYETTSSVCQFCRCHSFLSAIAQFSRLCSFLTLFLYPLLLFLLYKCTNIIQIQQTFACVSARSQITTDRNRKNGKQAKCLILLSNESQLEFLSLTFILYIIRT